MPAQAQIILFAMQSAVRLGAAARRAYVDATLARELVLPLPSFVAAPGIAAALQFFSQSPRMLAEGPRRRRDLLDKALVQRVQLSKDENDELVIFYMEVMVSTWRARDGGSMADGSQLSAAGLDALVTVRQWSRGADPNPSAAQRLAGTFVSIGVQYFTQVPGALDESSRSGRALLALLRGFEEIDFATEPLGKLPEKLFYATLETVGADPSIATSDLRVQKLISATASSLATDVHERIAELRAASGPDSNQEERIQEWAELVFRSVLGSAGRLVAGDPEGYLGIRDAASADAVKTVAGAAIALILDQPAGKLDQVFTRDSLDALVRASLQVAARHPELFSGVHEPALRNMLAALAGEVGKFERVLQPNALPRIAAAVVAETARNVPVLWPELATDPRKHLLVTAATTAVELLTREWPAGRWKVKLGPDQISGVVEAVVAEVAATPGWLFDSVGKQNAQLRVVLEAVVGVLRARGDARLNGDTAAAILRASLAAVATRAEFGAQLAGVPAIASALDRVLAQLFEPALDPKAAWALVRSEVVIAIVQSALAGLAARGVSQAEIEKTATTLREQIDAIADGGAWTLESVRKALS